MSDTRESGSPPGPEPVPEGTAPMVAVEGTAYECGRRYAEIVLERYPGYRRYLDPACAWRRDLSAAARQLFEARAPHVPEIFQGMADVAGPPTAPMAPPERAGGCTSFGVSGAVTLDGRPLSGQTKDTSMRSVLQYIVLRMRIQGAPDILALAYPGEVLGYGFWSTGMSLFRNSLHSTAGGPTGLTMEQWGLLALAGSSVYEAVEIARAHGLRGAGNCLISDASGESLSVEFTVGGVSVVPARHGIATHANHPEGDKTAPHEHYPHDAERENSRFRMHGLWQRLHAECGRLTPQKAMQLMADHERYPYGICRHRVGDDPNMGTSAAVVAQPTLGRLHVTRGHPCGAWPASYFLDDAPKVPPDRRFS